jgi:Alkaline phosphatase PhoX
MARKSSESLSQTDIGRRGFLRASTLGSGALVFGGGTLLTACDPVTLEPADENGIRTHAGFEARVVATTGQPVADTGYIWHLWPDGGGCFALPDGGWSYVSNSEWFFADGANGAGVSYIRFDSDGNITDAGRTLVDTVRNCSGGITPWDTWLSCEEIPLGAVWECDPLGATPAVKHEGMGLFLHEAAACHPGEEVIYLTEDHPTGAFYRYVPDTWGDLSSGTLEVLTEPSAGVLVWATVPDPTAAVTPCQDQVADTKRFNGGEGADLSGNNVIFTTKGDNQVWSYDPTAETVAPIFNTTINNKGILTGVDNVETSDQGVIYVCEDGGDMQIVLVREDGSTFPVLQIIGNWTSEICGAAFNPAGDRLYLSDQRNPGRTIEVKGPWDLFTDPGIHPAFENL